jgi:hypothetical protein
LAFEALSPLGVCFPMAEKDGQRIYFTDQMKLKDVTIGLN